MSNIETKNSPLYQIQNNKVVQVLPETTSNQVKINDTNKKLTEELTEIKNTKWGVVIDGPLPSDEEELQNLINSLPEGGSVYYDPDDNFQEREAVYLNAPFNTREFITESGEWEVPVTGWYKVTLINGGNGAFLANMTTYKEVVGGYGGRRQEEIIHLTKGQMVPVTIGAGGTGIITTTATGDFTTPRRGGNTSFGALTTSFTTAIAAPWAQTKDLSILLAAFGAGRGTGSRPGGSLTSAETWDGYFYGAGGSAVYLPGSPATVFAGNGASGCVIVEYCDPLKDKNISIDMATATTVQELKEEIQALSARVQELENE